MRVPSICAIPGSCYPKFSEFKGGESTKLSVINKPMMGQDKDNIASQHIEALNSVTIKLETHNYLLMTLLILIGLLIVIFLLKKLYVKLQETARKQLARERALERLNEVRPNN